MAGISGYGSNHYYGSLMHNTSRTSGASGASGTRETSDTSEASGVSGASGTSGTSGARGTSGASDGRLDPKVVEAIVAQALARSLIVFNNTNTKIENIEQSKVEEKSILKNPDVKTYCTKDTLKNFGFTDDEIQKYFTEKEFETNEKSNQKALFLNDNIKIDGKEIKSVMELIRATKHDNGPIVKNLAEYINNTADSKYPHITSLRLGMKLGGTQALLDFKDNYNGSADNFEKEFMQYLKDKYPKYF